MKTLTLLFILCSFIASAQNLGNTKDLAITQNGKCWNGLQVNDTSLLKGITMLTALAGNGTGVVGINNAGLLSYTNPNSIGAWTTNGTNVYLTDTTDNVLIGVTQPYPSYDMSVFLDNVIFYNDSFPDGYFEMSQLQNTLNLGDWADTRNNTVISINDATGIIQIGTGLATGILQLQFAHINTVGVPADSTSVSTKEVWIDVNGFLRRKF